MVKIELHRNVFNIQWRKICCCRKIYQSFKKQNLPTYDNRFKNVYFDVLEKVVDKYNNMVYHRTTKMKPADVKFDSYAECNVDSNEKDPKFQFVIM